MFLVKILPIMLALCSMLLYTYYAQNYAGIIGGSLGLTVVSIIFYIISTWLTAKVCLIHMVHITFRQLHTYVATIPDKNSYIILGM